MSGLPSRGLGLNQAPEQLDSLEQDRLLPRREALADRLSQPALPLGAVGAEDDAPLRGQVDERSAAVARVGLPAHQSRRLQVPHGLGHRLRPNPLSGGEIADTLGAFAVQPSEHGPMGDGKAMLGAEPAHELAEHDPEIAGQLGRVWPGGSGIGPAPGFSAGSRGSHEVQAN